MKTTIHPQWNADAQVSCVCGNTFTVGSTKAAIQVDLCYNCHPFFTNEMRLVDSLGRVARFRQAQERAAAQRQAGGTTSGSKKSKSNETLSFKEVLEAQKKSL